MAAYRYWRLRMTRWNYNGTLGRSGGIGLPALQFFTSANAQWPTSNMTSNSAPSPFVASASSEFSASYAAYFVFNGTINSSNKWYSSSNVGGAVQWIKIDMGSAVSFSKMKLAADEATLGGGYHLVDFAVEASATGTFTGEETVIASFDSLTSGWANNVLREFTLAPYEAPPFKFAFDARIRMASRDAVAFPPRLKVQPSRLQMLAYSGTSGQPMVGPGYVAGTLKVLTNPAARRVRLYDLETGILLRSTMSAADGTYRFDNMALGRKYFAVGHDDNSASPRRKADVADFFEAVQ